MELEIKRYYSKSKISKQKMSAKEAIWYQVGFSLGKIIQSVFGGLKQELRLGTQDSRNMLLSQGENRKSEFGLRNVGNTGNRSSKPWAPSLRAAPGIAPSDSGFSLALWFFPIQSCPLVWRMQLCGLVMPIKSGN